MSDISNQHQHGWVRLIPGVTRLHGFRGVPEFASVTERIDRGGPMWYADTVGLDEVYRRIGEFHRQHGELWEPAAVLKRLAQEGKTFVEMNREQAVMA